MTYLGTRHPSVSRPVGLAVAVLILTTASSFSAAKLMAANEIGFVEEFALADDRAAALEQLIPGTEDYYFYRCLHAQHTQQFKEADRLLAAWIKKHGDTARAQQIKLRQMLLQYDEHPRKTLDYLQRELGLHYGHQRDRTGTDPRLPNALDQQLISREVLLKRALRQQKNTDGFTDHAFDWLIGESLNPIQRRHFLSRLTRPDYPGLVKLIVDDLKQKDSGGFGSLPVHRLLLLEQLDECLDRKPNLLNQQQFVMTYLSKLAPNDDVDWQYDRAAGRAYLNRVWEFVTQLDPAHNSLKAHVLYRRLVLDRALGVYDKQTFLEYLQLPRHAPYINPRFMQLPESRRYAADLNFNSQGATLLQPIGNDEPLVRSYLQHFFIKDTNYKAYEPYLLDTYLKRLFAETKITEGIGDANRWYEMLLPAEVKALKDRIDLEFAASNPSRFEVDDEVQLDLHVKNIKKLIVKVFRINTENYYREQGRAVNTDIELDGLVANEELSFAYDQPSQRRVLRSFKFPQLDQRGVYVIDFIGNGISSRAVVRKGSLRYLVRTGAAGQVFTILNEVNQQIDDANVWVGGTKYVAGDDGAVVVPFSTKPGRQPVILSHDGFAALHHFQHEAENYNLQAAFYLDREALIKHRRATIVVRPRLFVNGTPIGLGSLENVRMLITSVDLDGTKTSTEVADFKLYEDRESTHTIQVPARLNTLQLEVRADIEQLSLNKQLSLVASKSLALNEIDKTPRTEDVHFLKSGDEYVLEVLGRSGESRAKRPLRIVLQHRDFRQMVHTNLQSNEQGQIALGRLDDIEWIKVKSLDGAEHQWWLPTDDVAVYQTMHGVAGKTLRVPYVGAQPAASEVSLLSMHRGTPVADLLDNVGWKAGFLELDDLAPGDYQLTLKRDNRQIRLRITDGKISNRHVMGDTRLLEVRNDNPLQIQSTEFNKKQLKVKLAGASKFTRVHVFATRYQPAFSPYAQFSQIRDAEPTSYLVPAVIAQYMAGRDIGDEYRYVLDRKYADKLPGNMLQRPSLLLNPWAIRDTQTGQQVAAEGADFQPAAPGPVADQERAADPGESVAALTDASNVDFLSEASAVIVNLRPDENGVLTVAADELAGHRSFHIVAVDPLSTSYRQVAAPVAELITNDLRLALALDPQGHYAQRKQVTVLKTGESFVVPDVTSAKFDYYDSLSRLYRLYATLSGDEKLAKFEFVTRWPQLSEDEKREKYSEFACHELNYFLLHKDPKFLEQTVLPYVANKKDKTFLDRWLLNDALDEFQSPWRHSQLNIVERILLGQGSDLAAMQRHVGELFELVPRDVSRLNSYFDFALSGRALDGDDDGLALGIQSQLEKRAKFAQERLREMARQPMGRERLSRAEKVRSDARADRAENEELDVVSDDAFLAGAALEDAVKMRGSYRRLYVQLEKTKEWVENNYYQLPLETQNADLVRVNAFWNDFAQHQGDGQFFSRHWAEASNNFTEIMLALASIDLPFEAKEHEHQFDEAKLTLTAGSPMVIFHQQIQPVDTADQVNRDGTSILVSQNFYRNDDRYEVRGGVTKHKFVTDEFLVHTVYGSQAVITNPTSAQVKAEVLLQIPVGSIPVAGSHYTRSITVDLAPYSSQALEYQFYFPVSGQYDHFPVHVSDDETMLGFAQPVSLKAVDRLSTLDTTSWAYVSQFGSDLDVMAFLQENNVQELDLSRIAFRMQEKQFFTQVTDLLRARHAYNDVLWSYSLRHQAVEPINEFLSHSPALVNRIGPSIESELITIEPVDRHIYQHREYWPLVNSRAHQLGRLRRILNDRFHAQYHALLQWLSYQPSLNNDDLMAVVYYMALQDRITEARKFYNRIQPDSLQTNIQYDYLTAYLDCFNIKPTKAQAIATRYDNYPVDRWRESFAAISALLAEIDGEPTEVVAARDRDQNQAQLAGSEPTLEVSMEGTELRIDHNNLAEVQVRYYLMDLELLFSRNPFVTEFAGQFSHIFPNDSQAVTLQPATGRTSVELPKDLHNKNVLVEVASAGGTKSVSYYSNSLRVDLSDAYGQLRVTERGQDQGLAAVYVKVYAELQDGSVRFYKDGYTDLRGKFDYTSLSTNELDAVRRFSILVLSEDHGAIVREAVPPKQ